MAPRLVELYPIGTRVEIQMMVEDVEVWRPGEVVAHQFPAVWVRTDDRKAWFVTNGRRIRRPGAAANGG